MRSIGCEHFNDKEEESINEKEEESIKEKEEGGN
jgi:hypothetical protein